MKSFISEVAEYIIKNNDSFKNISIVVPNRRTGLFIKQALADQLQKPAIAPEITPIKEIFTKNSTYTEAEEILLLFLLFECFSKHTDKFQEFDEFYFWGEIILKDFDYIDKYLIDNNKLFANIKDIKEIDSLFDTYDETELEIIKKFWQHIDQAKISEHKHRFLELWEKMNLIFAEFKNKLSERGIAYEGLIYRQVAENINNVSFNKDNYYFVGFSALNRCEHKLFDVLTRENKAKFFWDADQYYISDEIREAGYFIRENIKKFPNAPGFIISDNISQKNFKAEILVAPTEIAQMKLIPQILDDWKDHEDFIPEKTAIILADENLLIPLMYSIPEEFQNYNISMGYPIKSSNAFSFINLLCQLRLNVSLRKNKNHYYFKNVINLLKHGFLSEFFAKECKELEEYIVKNKLIVIEEEVLHKNDFLKKLFTISGNSIKHTTEWLSQLINEVLFMLPENDNFKIEAEFMRKISLRINVLSDTIISNEIDFSDLRTYFRLLQNSLYNLSVPFEGEPLQGLQILGFIETRALDFDKIIMLSINEGHFPKNTAPQSIIPYNLRKFYGLPAIEYQDSIYAYYFYRLFQRAKDIKIIYSAQSQDGKGEASRFISQLEYELKNISQTGAAYKINTLVPQKIIVKKTKEIISRIKEQLQKGISPSSINTYLNCPLMYYFRYIEKIKEPDKLEEKEDAAYFGSVFHESMNFLYESLPKRVLTERDLDYINNEQNINAAIKKAISSVLKIEEENIDIDQSNTLLAEVVHKYVKLMMDFDKKELPLTIIDLESSHHFMMEINTGEEIINCKIEGIIDRIDLKDGVYRVLDYKTGKITKSVKSLDDLFEDNRKNEFNAITQTLLYSLMYKPAEDLPICPGLINTNELATKADHKIKINKKLLEIADKDLQNDFLEQLRKKLEILTNNSNDIIQTENYKTCDYCDYKKICMR